jgi:AcrR family transcriptional regulator
MKDDRRARDVKSSILDAADRMLASRGYKKMTIDDLAAAVGIGKGSVYLHFSSKEEIALSHIDAIIERLKTRLHEISQTSAPYDERVREMLIERVMFRFDSVQHYTQSLNDLLSKIRPGLIERRKRHFEEESRIFARIIQSGVDEGSFASANVDDTARSLLLATNSLLPFSLSARELGERNEIEKRISSLADLLLKGLVSR